jgi:nucleoside-diphosphate-sugar epimerase
LIIIRSPLVYGPGVKGNFLSLIKLANNNFPAPFGGIVNLRSLLYIDNLTSFVHTCIMDREIRRSIYMVSDPHPISTTKLFKLIRKALNVESQLFVMPKIGKLCIKVILGINFYNKIYSSLVICWDKANRELGWTPLIPSESGIKYTIEEYLKSVKKNS